MVFSFARDIWGRIKGCLTRCRCLCDGSVESIARIEMHERWEMDGDGARWALSVVRREMREAKLVRDCGLT